MTFVVKFNGSIAKSCRFVDLFHLSPHHFFTIQQTIPLNISILSSFYCLPPPSFEPALLVLLPSFLPFILSVICPILLYHPYVIFFLQISYPTDFRSSNSTDGLGSRNSFPPLAFSSTDAPTASPARGRGSAGFCARVTVAASRLAMRGSWGFCPNGGRLVHNAPVLFLHDAVFGLLLSALFIRPNSFVAPAAFVSRQRLLHWLTNWH